MSTITEQKIKKLLDQYKPGTVCLASWLEELGISYDLQKRYRRSGWLSSIGTGAFVRPGDEVTWQGGLYALQTQANLPIHAGAITALAMQDMSHYLRLGSERIFLFAPPKTILPAWFRSHDWQVELQYIKTSFLPAELGMINHEEKTFSIDISTAERAILECLYLAPRQLDLLECYQVMEGLFNLRPKLLQQLLESCSSIRVKRLFFYMAEKAGHQWANFLDREKLNLGTGDRSITKGGVYIAEHRISIPKELAAL
ncbi:hypothetical protein Pse7367_3733 (plasmid) [Thalassoporum mexicanum PCC 7367]|uniref:type IV toxin-antitoxin system AbiEi family antitoxin n=1 Tax=Thalassoporum mexicanum TaxID=3457544 RepID=UPI00029FE9A4|nr:type IV toxin-antitoxin system AbiEi family antitoxin [Pseudanabaena sp. PCC 7367]AFY71959.1 hypothetical protein Pse7367_3733 [Pseudanabaena sp. PCC 7367]